jgi:ankyrin repeat protein
MVISNKELQERNRRTDISIVREMENHPKFGNFAKANAFVQAAMFSLQEELERMLNEGIDVNIRTEVGSTALMATNDIRIVKFLLSKGANPNLINNAGCNALMTFLGGIHKERNAIKVIQALLEADADPTLVFPASQAFDVAQNKYVDIPEMTVLDFVKTEYSEKVYTMIEEKIKSIKH